MTNKALHGDSFSSGTLIHFNRGDDRVVTPPARRAWRSIKFAPVLFYFFSVSKVGQPLMGDTAGFSLLFSALLHI